MLLSKVYVKPRRKYTMELFLQKNPTVNVRLFSKYTTVVYIRPLNLFLVDKNKHNHSMYMPRLVKEEVWLWQLELFGYYVSHIALILEVFSNKVFLNISQNHIKKKISART